MDWIWTRITGMNCHRPQTQSHYNHMKKVWEIPDVCVWCYELYLHAYISVTYDWMSMERWWNDRAMSMERWWNDRAMSMERWWNNRAMSMERWWNDRAMSKERWWNDRAMSMERWWNDRAMSMERWWNDTDRATLKYWDRPAIITWAMTRPWFC